MRVSFLGGVLLLACACAAHAQTTTQPIQSEMDLLRQENTTLRAQIVELQHEISELRAGHSATTKPAARLSDTERAIANHQIISGMSVDDVTKSLGTQGYSSRPPYSIQDGAPMEWNITDASLGVPIGRYRVLFTKSGKVIRWEKQ